MFQIQHTKRGDYLVRGYGGREFGRYESAEAAQAAIAAEQQRLAAEMAASDMRREAQDAWDRMHPDLIARQLRWQTWRNWLYARICHHGQLNARTARALDRQGRRPGYWEHRNDEELFQAVMLYEGEMVLADGVIKAARRAQDTGAYETALLAAERLIQSARQLFTSDALPDDPSVAIPPEAARAAIAALDRRRPTARGRELTDYQVAASHAISERQLAIGRAGGLSDPEIDDARSA